MLATTYDIEEKRRESPIGLANIKDFKLIESSQIESEVILENPHISLYSLDFGQQQAVFVETPPDINLSQAPFYYSAQYENAVRVLTLPLINMIQLAQSVTIDDKQLVFIYSVGRAGSTLASQIFAQIDGVVNISEPDVLSILVAARYYQLTDDANLLELLKATVSLLCKTPARTAWAIKGRSFVIELGDWLHQTYPQAKNVFLYRNAETWLKSALSAYSTNVERTDEEVYAEENQFRQLIAPVAPLIAKHDAEQHLSHVEILVLMWLSVMEKYIQLYKSGIEILAIQYSSWHSAPYKTAMAMLTYCGLTPTSTTSIQQVLMRDSQGGTFMSQASIKQRGRQIQNNDLEELNRHLQNHALIASADFKVPNTFTE